MTMMNPTQSVEPGAPGKGPGGKGRGWKIGCLVALGLLLVILLTVGITLWWVSRPITPVVLTPPEKAEVDRKLAVLEGAETPEPGGGAAAIPGGGEPLPPGGPAGSEPVGGPEPDRPYMPGSRILRLTEREVNGLLNQNTDLGNEVRIEFARDAVNAYIAVPIPKDFPVGGGTTVRARGRFRVAIGDGAEPVAVLEDLTVFGLSLPKAWLGGVKGENLLKDAVKGPDGEWQVKGIKSLKVEPGALVLEVEE